VNKAIIGGVISSYGVRLSYTQAAKPQLLFQLDIEESGFHTFVPCQIVGPQAEGLAETLEPGEYVLVDGKLSWSKAQNKLQVVAFGVERLSTSPQGDVPHEGAALKGSPRSLILEAARRRSPSKKGERGIRNGSHRRSHRIEKRLVAAEENLSAALWALDGMVGVSMKHLLWRLAGNRTTPMMIQLRGSCPSPLCAIGSVEWTMRIHPIEDKPEGVNCVLCHRELHILSAKPLPN
jgi:single-stranded DNA-binding protein